MSGRRLANLPKVLIGDHHPVVLAGLRSLLRGVCEIVGESQDGQSPVDAALRLRPELIILAINLPKLNGIDAASRIKAQWPEARLLFFSTHTDIVYVRRALQAGGAGYLSKACVPEELRAGIETVLRGGRYLTPALAREVLEKREVPPEKGVSSSFRLSERQREILQLITEGFSNKETATRLNLSVKTVEFHRIRLMQKLGVHSAAELAAAAVRNHLVVDSEPVPSAGQLLEKKELADLLRARMDDVKQRVAVASLQAKEIQKAFGTGSSPDGNLALARALHAENSALAEYNRMLRLYNDLTVYGRIPNEDAQSVELSAERGS